MTHLRYLMGEICTGIEIYYTGRVGGQYLKTAFVLCDDYTELTSKLFLKEMVRNWTGEKGRGFKNYHDVHKEVREAVEDIYLTDLPIVRDLHEEMKKRRKRRNEFFHSTHLLDLNVTHRDCVEAFCDLLDYGELLFGADWLSELEGPRNLNTLAVMLRLEKKGFGDPAMISKVDSLFRNMERNHKNATKKGSHVTYYGEDLYVRLCVVHGGPELKDRLSTLL